MQEVYLIILFCSALVGLPWGKCNCGKYYDDVEDCTTDDGGKSPHIIHAECAPVKELDSACMYGDNLPPAYTEVVRNASIAREII